MNSQRVSPHLLNMNRNLRLSMEKPFFMDSTPQSLTLKPQGSFQGWLEHLMSWWAVIESDYIGHLRSTPFTCVCVCVYIHAHIHARIYIFIYIHTHIIETDYMRHLRSMPFMCVCLCIYAHIHACIHTHTQFICIKDYTEFRPQRDQSSSFLGSWCKIAKNG